MKEETRNLEQELHQKNERIAELETVLECWFSIFGTNQLTHAQDRLNVAEDKVKRLEAGLTALRGRIDEGKILGIMKTCKTSYSGLRSLEDLAAALVRYLEDS